MSSSGGTELRRAGYGVQVVKRWVVACLLLAATLNGCGFIDSRPAPLARTCAEWSRLDADERPQTAEAFIEPGLMGSVPETQQLSADTPDDAVLLLVGSTFDMVCEFQGEPGTRLAEIVTNVYR